MPQHQSIVKVEFLTKRLIHSVTCPFQEAIKEQTYF